MAEVGSGLVLASPDVCDVVAGLGVPRSRLRSARAGQRIANIDVLPGFSATNDPVYTFFYLLSRRRRPEPGGTPLSFLVKDDATLLHIGDANEAPLPVRPDILCLPWRRTPFWATRYQKTMILLAQGLAAPYVLPVHHDLPGYEADPQALKGRIAAEILGGTGWYNFRERHLVRAGC